LWNLVNLHLIREQLFLCLHSDDLEIEVCHLRPGDRLTVRLQAWTNVSAQYEKINRSEIDDPSIELEEPVWGEVQN
jgi:hypothetical protein